jgi:hypothetical protein
VTVSADPRDKTYLTTAQRFARSPVTCGHCGRTVRRTARHQLYCSRRCRVSAHRAKSALQPTKIAPRYPRSGGETPPVKKARDSNHLRERFSGSTPQISGPRHVIGAEVFGDRTWRVMISPDGVTVEVSRLRARALVSQ